MHPETFPRFAAGDGAGYTIRREDRRYLVVQLAPGTDTAQGAALCVAGPFESRHAAVAAAQRCARGAAGVPTPPDMRRSS